MVHIFAFHIDDDDYDSPHHVLHPQLYLHKSPPGGPQSQQLHPAHRGGSIPTTTTTSCPSVIFSPTLPPLTLNQTRSTLLVLSSLVPSAIPARASTHPVDSTILGSSNSRTRTLTLQRASISTTSAPSSLPRPDPFLAFPSAAHFGLRIRCPWPVFVYTR